MSRALEDRQARLRRVGTRLLRKRGLPGAPRENAAGAWDAAYFGLDRLPAWRGASEAQRVAALRACNGALIDESWGIERTGIVFCARMVLLAEGLEERRLFSLIGAEEAMHSAWLEPWRTARADEADAFNRFIESLVQSGARQPLAFLLQVVLEGFGIAHYAGLARSCRDAALARTLKTMAQDEAAHHAAGLAAFSADQLSSAEGRFLAEGAGALLDWMRCGPQRVVAALDAALGGLGRSGINTAFDNLHDPALDAAKLAELRRLMALPSMTWLVDELEARGSFTPRNAAQCAALYAS